jgi:predicted Zn-dependent protease with MMP-like domain
LTQDRLELVRTLINTGLQPGDVPEIVSSRFNGFSARTGKPLKRFQEFRRRSTGLKPGVTEITLGERSFMSVNLKKLEALASVEVEATLAALPAPLREQARKLPVLFERQPSRALQSDGIEPDTPGLFTGPEFAYEEHATLPPQIILFLENIWDAAESDEAFFREEVRTTFLHELGHYLGLDEDELTERGLE